jgi:imidazolonepropionase-like amidohydrolase
MKHLPFSCAALVVAAVGLSASSVQQRPASVPLAVANLTVIDGSGTAPRQGMTILVRDGRIESIGPADSTPPPSGARVIDGRGLVAIPGLIDAHVHLSSTPRTQQLAKLKTALRGGVTTVWDLAGDTRNVSELSRESLAGEIESPAISYAALMAGPDFFSDPRVVESSLGYEPGTAPWARAITADTDVAEAVAEARGTGANALKLYAALDAAAVVRITAEGHRRGLRVVAHGTVFPAKPSDLVEAGVDMLAHAAYLPWEGSPAATDYRKRAKGDFAGVRPESPAIDRLLTAMADRRVALNPTLVVFADQADSDGLKQQRVRWGAEVTRRAHEKGVAIVAGTDDMVADGAGLPNLHRELELLVAAGLTPLEALTAATGVAAEAMGLGGERGILAPGLVADIVLLEASPEQDIRRTRQVRYVLKNGAVVGESQPRR